MAVGTGVRGTTVRTGAGVGSPPPNIPQPHSRNMAGTARRNGSFELATTMRHFFAMCAFHWAMVPFSEANLFSYVPHTRSSST